MKHSALIAILSASMLLTSCSTNTQPQNTGIGAVSGAVVGGLAGGLVGGTAAVAVGIVGGALVGGLIGHSMDSTDNTTMTTVVSKNPTGQPTTWTNTKTGVTYTVKPVSGMMTVNGNPNCRKFKTTAMINHEKRVAYSVACMQSNGSWMTVK